MNAMLKDRLREWQGTSSQKEAASDLGIPLATYRKFLYGKRTPNKLAMAELGRRMDDPKLKQRAHR